MTTAASTKSTFAGCEVISLPVLELKPYLHNPRKNDLAVDAVAHSISEFGFRQPIVVDSNMVVIVGHTRLKAAKKLGMTEVPVIVADMTPAQARAYRLVDNKTNELSEWDTELLALELQNISEKLDVTSFGFNALELKAMLGTLNFEPGTVDQQGKLGELSPKIVTCPHCGECFDLREM